MALCWHNDVIKFSLLIFFSYSVNHEFNNNSILPPINQSHQQPHHHIHHQPQQLMSSSAQYLNQNSNQSLDINGGDQGKCKECGSHSSMSHYKDYNGNILPSISNGKLPLTANNFSV